MNEFFDFIFANADFKYSRIEKNVTVVNGKEKSTLIVNVLGINPSDIKVDIVDDCNYSYLTVKGKTDDDVSKRNYYVDYSIRIKPDRVEKIEKTYKNGILYLDVIWKQMAKSKIDIVEK